MHASLHARVKLCAQRGLACFPDSIDTSISLIRPNLAEILACACKLIGCMHTSLCAWGEVCACSSDSIDTLISLIQPNLAEIWASAHKHIVDMQARLNAWVVLCTQIGLVCSPDSIDTLFSLI